MNGRNITPVLFVCLVTLGFTFFGCSGPMEYQMEPGERTASSEGALLLDFDDNENKFMELNVAHLPPPSRLGEGYSTFVVWLKPEASTVHYNMGQLRVGADRAGFIEFTTPFDAFELRVTAEVQPNVLEPSDQEVLRRNIGMD